MEAEAERLPHRATPCAARDGIVRAVSCRHEHARCTVAAGVTDAVAVALFPFLHAVERPTKKRKKEDNRFEHFKRMH